MEVDLIAIPTEPQIQHTEPKIQEAADFLVASDFGKKLCLACGEPLTGELLKHGRPGKEYFIDS